MSDNKYKPCIYVGSDSGLLKAVDLGKRTATNYYGPNELEKHQSIDHMAIYGEKRMLVAMRNGQAKCFDCTSKSFKNPVPLFESDKFDSWSGLDVVENGIVGVAENGVIRAWSMDEFNKKSESEEMDLENVLAPISETIAKVAGKVRHSKVRRKAIVLGGEECQLQMFDLEHLDKGSVFTAKSVKPDKLQLHIPINFPAVALPTDSEIIACSAYGSLTGQNHELRIYDPRAVQRRPVKRIEWSNHPITSVLSMDSVGNQYVVGNARGKIAMIDLRNPTKLRSFKGAAGSIRDLYQHGEDKTKFGAVGLDRHLHIYETKNCSKIHKVYLKSPLNCLVMEPGCLLEKQEEKVDNGEESDEDYENKQNVWTEMDGLESVQDD